jgi:hypothetical protein
MTTLNLYQVEEGGAVHWVSAVSEDHALCLVGNELEKCGCDANDPEATKLDESSGRDVSLMEDENATNMWNAHLQSTKGRYLACSEW